MVRISVHAAVPRCYDRHVDSSATRNALVLAALNLKGGVGKTHAAWLTAAVCEERGLRLLIIDTDTQGNLSNSFLDATDHRPGVETLLDPAADGNVASLIRRTALPNIDIIPASPALVPFDLSDQRQWEPADLHLSLTEAVAEIRTEYDLILFDCPPRLSLVSFAALCAADGVVIPMEAADWGAQGIIQVTEAIRYVQERYNPRLQLLGYLVSRFKRARAYQRKYLEQLRAHFGDLAFDTVIPDLARFEQSVTDRIPITRHAPRSKEAEIARAFVDELLRRSERNRSSGRRSVSADARKLAVTGAG